MALGFVFAWLVEIKIFWGVPMGALMMFLMYGISQLEEILVELRKLNDRQHDDYK